MRLVINDEEKTMMQGLKHGFEKRFVSGRLYKNIIVYLTHLKRID